MRTHSPSTRPYPVIVCAISAIPFFLFLALDVAVLSADAEEAPQPQGTPIRSVVAIESVGRSGRSPVFTDAVERRLVDGSWSRPKPGDSVQLPDGTTRTWQNADADEKDTFRGPAFRRGYAYAEIESPIDRIAILKARGHRHVYINRVPRGGDVYSLGFVKLPIRLKKGTNELLFKTGRGSLKATLLDAPADQYLIDRDLTLPNLISGEAGLIHVGVIVGNPSVESASSLRLALRGLGLTDAVCELPDIPPLSIRKVPATFEIESVPEGTTAEISFALLDENNQTLHTIDAAMTIRTPGEKHVRTFISSIDGSVQYYALTPARQPEDSENEKPALFLSLHGAGVQASRQASCYTPKSWGHVVAPTNRRPFGFDWEDWGRIDALEVLDIAERRLDSDPRRTYVTGHSMGGHGAWSLGVLFPDRFAGVAPCSGWRDFWGYVGREPSGDLEPSDVRALVERAANGSRTVLLEKNLRENGVYILHGERDNNVPVEQARFMRERLAKFHPNWTYYERKGAGHWWGNQCMDWPPLFEFLKRNIRPQIRDTLEVEFETVSPGISAIHSWVTIEAQSQSMAISRVEAKLNPKESRLEITTDNIARLLIDLGPFLGSEPVLARDKRLAIAIDEQTLDSRTLDGERSSEKLRFVRADGESWRVIPGEVIDRSLKSPSRCGPFKEAFHHRMLFVYGTIGSTEENHWSLDKARFDAETFWYRGNGSIDVVADVDFDPDSNRHRSVILYGNSENNSAWGQLLEGCPIVVRRNEIRVGEQLVEGEDLACLFVYPKRDSSTASVGVVAGTGLIGLRLTHQLPYFVSGVAYPDWTILSVDLLDHGWGGVLGAGYFGEDWSLEKGESSWQLTSNGRPSPRK